jgi:hypothetical protein
VVCYRLDRHPPGGRCLSCAQKKKGCSLVGKASPEKRSKADEQAPDVEEIEEDEAEVVAGSSSSKGKGLFSFPKALKRKTADRSPDSVTSLKKSGQRGLTVCVQVPAPPIPLDHYQQLGSRSSAPSVIVEDPHLPPSSSPSLTSLRSHFTSSSQHFETERLQILLNAAQEELVLTRCQYDEQIARQSSQFARERAMYLARIKELEGGMMGGGGSSWK